MASAPVDIPIQIKGLSDLQKLDKRMQALEKEVTRLQKSAPKAANGISKFGLAARGSAGGVKALSVAVKSALGPITALLGAVAGLGAAFNTIKNQDFAQAKFESLGGDSQQLVTNLKAVSNELQGTASVAELTGAAYDVASAGFSSAAEASLVLKAASLGATGGFSDINTVANATTSVLNAYGKSAADAGLLVDQFIQTQNDGKIVVSEYADNIGKVASAAASLGVPLSEVNAVIAQSTAAGNQAETVFTGLKGALARLASGEAEKALAGTGIEISAASVEADGLLGTLKKLEGLDTGKLFKALGTEAGPALIPVIENLEKYEQLIKNQEESQGTAAQAAATAAGTIEGAWKRVTIAFENLFSDQTELGQVIRAVLLMAAATVEAFGAAFTATIAPIRAVIAAVMEIAKAWTGVKDGEEVLQSLTALWFDFLAAAQDASNTVVAVGQVIGQYVGKLVNEIKYWFNFLFGDIISGAGELVTAIPAKFAEAFTAAKGIIDGFWNSLPGWLKGALNAAGSVVGGITSAVTSALGTVIKDIQAAKAQVEISVPDKPKTEGNKPNGGLPTPGGATGGTGASGEAQKAADLTAQRLADSEKLITAAQREGELMKANNEFEKVQLESRNAIFEIAEKYGELAEKSLSDAETENLLRAQGLEIENERYALEEKLAGIKDKALGGIDEEIAHMEAILEGTEKEYLLKKAIADLEAQGIEGPVAEARVLRLEQLKEEVKAFEEMEAKVDAVAGKIAGSMTDAFSSIIDGSKSAEEALGDMMKDIAKSFIDMAADIIKQQIQMIIKGMIMKALGISMPGAGAAPQSNALKVGWPGNQNYDGGGYTGSAPRSGGIDGKGGFPAILHPQETVVDHTKAMGGYGPNNGGGGGGNGGSVNVHYDGPTLNFNQDQYLPVSAVPGIIKEAASAGEKQTMNKMRNSPSARRRAGI